MTVLRQTTPRARREHGCDLGCGAAIDQGERHAAQTVAADGRVYTFRSHLHCDAIAQHDHATSDCWSDDPLPGDIPLQDWSRADIEAACDRQRWAPSHPSRERARALWQAAHGDEPIPQMIREWWNGTWRPGTAIVRVAR